MKTNYLYISLLKVFYLDRDRDRERERERERERDREQTVDALYMLQCFTLIRITGV